MSKDLYAHITLDRTGSMARIWNEAVGGVNGFIKEQAKEDGTAYISLTVFDNVAVDRLVTGKNAQDIDPIDANEIFPRGMTNLLDAIGLSIEDADDWLASNKDFDGKILFVVNTDGHENASKEFKLDAIRDLVKDKTDEGWEFVFMGAGIDAFADSANLGFDPNKSLSYAATGRGTAQAAASLSMSTRSMRGSSDGTFKWEDSSKK